MGPMDHPGLLLTLPTEQRLALAYAPAATRSLCLGMLALDARLAGIVRTAKEPLLGQVQLAWWREQLMSGPAGRPSGEPLLAALGQWQGHEEALVRLIDGWEGMLGGTALDRPSLETLAAARGHLWARIAALTGHDGYAAVADRLGQRWATVDLASRLSTQGERVLAIELAGASDWAVVRLPRALRALTVLDGLARRTRGRGPMLDGPMALLVAIRLGLVGS